MEVIVLKWLAGVFRWRGLDRQGKIPKPDKIKGRKEPRYKVSHLRHDETVSKAGHPE
jgi:hypothetical protein